MNRSHIPRFTLLVILSGLLISCVPNIFYSNSGESQSYGTPANGSLENAYRLKYKTGNSKYFSPISYYLSGNGYVHSRLYHTIIHSYAECETTCPDIKFIIMECSDKKGGRLLLHRTHRNGLSADFMVPKKKDNKQKKLYDKMGLWHYLINFDSSGRLKINKKVEIDFESMAKHIIALDNAAKRNGLSIKKIIFKINLKDDLYKTSYGQEIKHRGIYFARYLTPKVDMVHDDHYHIDFQLESR